MIDKARIIGNVGLIVGQCFLLFVSRDVGLIILLSSSAFTIPYFWKQKMWDVLLLITFGCTVNIAGLLFQ